ncbi:DUF5753 domain-containing protein [Amycolatopsis sp. NPDC059027]|uniref:DUF5753 domain-containing protein n=1 Tax=Amycolatopsis sp. NPDC059027 TaxID=3346709 RepID=UPI00366ED21E
MARNLGIEPATVSLAEHAVRTPGIDYVHRVLGFLAVTGGEFQRLVALARHTKEPNWAEPGPHEYPALLLEYERTAEKIRVWAPQVVPDLVQTPDYARAILDRGLLTDDEVAQGLMMRLVRHDAALARNPPAALTVLLAEEVLEYQVGGTGVLQEQLRHLLTLIETDRIEVRVVPTGPDRRSGPLGPFALFDFPAQVPVVGVCQDHLYAYFTEPRHVDRYEETTRRLMNRALSEQASHARITNALAVLAQPRSAVSRMSHGGH